MRIDPKTCSIIKKTVIDELGSGTVIRLFGSRADDRKRGGDIDLHLEPEHPVRDRIRTECLLAARLFVRLGGRQVDLLIRNPRTSVRPVDEEAHRHGVVL
uniref:Nucleotidyltransferase domain-containing protein n=1 Tax=Leptospirillum ferriphilum TaxID=178606 RepID=A0A7C3LYI8_9BACT